METGGWLRSFGGLGASCEAMLRVGEVGEAELELLRECVYGTWSVGTGGGGGGE